MIVNSVGSFQPHSKNKFESGQQKGQLPPIDTSGLIGKKTKTYFTSSNTMWVLILDNMRPK